MTHATLEFAQFKLTPGTDTAQLLRRSADLDTAFAATPGFVARRLVREGDTWADVVEWTDRPAALAAMDRLGATPVGAAYIALIDMSSLRMQHFDIVR